jgi:hypothetical protein
MNLRGHRGFALWTKDNSAEANAVAIYSLINNITVVRMDKTTICPDNLVPCGDIDWCIRSLGHEVKPEYYPVWLSPYLHRKIWEEDKWPLKKVFVKPSDRYKRFDGFITTGTYKKKKKPPFYCSEIIHFKDEWRYYITKGKVVASGWYMGDEVNTPVAPTLGISIPDYYCGALDFGLTYKGEFALVEAQHPFSCGWYGTQQENEKYLQWLVDGWAYMKELKCE